MHSEDSVGTVFSITLPTETFATCSKSGESFEEHLVAPCWVTENNGPTDTGTRLFDFAIVPGTGVIRTHGVQEGPDVIDPLGREMTGAEGRSGEEAGTSDGTAWRGARRGTGGVEIRNAGRRTNEDRER